MMLGKHRKGSRRGAKLAAGLSLLIGSLAATAGVAGADDLQLPIETVITATPGSSVELGRIPIDRALAGPNCTWEASVTNQTSEHPGNDLLLTSGDSTLVLADIEATAGKTTTSSGSVYLVNEVVVSLRMGPDGIFSGGLSVVIRYDQCVPVTTPPPTTTVSTASVSLAPVVSVVPEPLGPQVNEPAAQVTTTAAPTTAAPTTAAPTTTTATRAAAPVLAVTGNRPWQPWVASGLALVGVGAVLMTGARGAASRRARLD